jgi:hypothetical protein
VDEVALGQGFTEYFPFPCYLSFARLLHPRLLLWADAAGRLETWAPSGTQSYFTAVNKQGLFRRDVCVGDQVLREYSDCLQMKSGAFLQL